MTTENTNSTTTATTTETTTPGPIARLVAALAGAVAWVWAALLGLPRAVWRVAKWGVAVTIGAAALVVGLAFVAPAPSSSTGADLLVMRATLMAETEAAAGSARQRAVSALRAKAAAEGHALSPKDRELLERKLQHLLDHKGQGAGAPRLNLPEISAPEGTLQRYIVSRPAGMVSGSSDQDLRVLAEVAPELGVEVRTHVKGSGWFGQLGEKIGLGHLGAQPLFK